MFSFHFLSRNKENTKNKKKTFISSGMSLQAGTLPAEHIQYI
jgi:hypothetical protein